jgi:multidrug efflux pump subunit AcrA (membrane-fusion protein)
MEDFTTRKKEEMDPQEKSFRRRKDIIKNFIIVFLVIMLVLTFFSNTIMNYSLPKVAVQYIESGTITSVIRGQGTVESGDPYNVMVKNIKTVGSIHVREGQEVKEGDLLLTLQAEDSEELTAAKDKLDEAKAAYDQILLSDAVTAAIISSTQGTFNVDEYRAKISAAQTAVTAVEKTVAEKQKVVDDLNNQKSITSVQKVTEAERTNESNLRAVVTQKESAKDSAAEALTSANASLAQATAAVNTATAALAAAQAANPQVQADIDAATADLATANAALASAQSAKNTAQSNYDAAVSAYNTAYNAWKPVADAITKKENNISDTVTSLDNQLAQAQIALDNANKDLTAKKDALTELIANIGTIRSLNDAQEAINKAQKEVDKYSEVSGAAEVKAPINGTVLSVNVQSGKKTSTDEAVVVLQPEGQGFLMKFTLENDKAKGVSVGDPAEVTNSWWYSDVKGTVASIRPDKSNPNRNKEITLSLEGSLTQGQQLTMQIQSRTQNYDLVVPSSAVHNDTKGDFILVCESKSSPLGNRYYAVRYDVEVLASDDTKTAISAGIMGYEYVITTASKPIEAGSEVRLQE